MDNYKALFIVNSPFQALCAIEAIHYYDIQSPYFVHYNEKIIKELTTPILEKYGKQFFVDRTEKNIFALSKATKQIVHDKFNRIFIGDWFSCDQYVVAMSVVSRNAHITYLDDGNSTLAIMPPQSKKRYKTKGERVIYCLYSIIERILGLKSDLFTIFELGRDCPLPVVYNPFSSLSTDTNVRAEGVFIIGTNPSVLTFKIGYENELSLLYSFIRDNYPNDPVYYCPHRRDRNDYSELFKHFGWELFNTEAGVEIDFVRKGIKPRLIIGFGSTALLTLKRIFHDASVLTIFVEYLSDVTNREFREIEKYYNSAGILTIRLNNL